MKQKGFRYLAWVPKPKPRTDVDKAAGGDYEAMKRVRSKRGFNVFIDVLDSDSERDQAAVTAGDDPNSAIRESLSKAQSRSYDKALNGCQVKAVKDVTGKNISSMADEFEQYETSYKAAVERELNGDPELVELASAMGDCLKGKGYRVDSVSPTGMSERGYREFSARMNAIAKKQGLVDAGADDNTVYRPRLSQAEANKYLAEETKAALDDLECGKSFYADFGPKAGGIAARLDSEFGRWTL
ncbi:hypothetical protein [Nonomuraea sp. NPDC050786]|uniref:hypothetical protein n=1 Tax=Nonomuraea sp. NPDC050786 TaxID=3154840 RepID=UPI0033EA9DFC